MSEQTSGDKPLTDKPLTPRAYEPEGPRPDGDPQAPPQSEIPKWRKDFPIEWGMDHYVTRRDFTKFLVLISGATALGNGYFVLRKFQNDPSNHPRLKVAAADEIPVGEVKLFRYPTDNDPAILLRLGEDEYAAYLQRCTHLTCPVLYSRETQQLECPCHHGYFDARTGEVLAGPPPRPLPRIALEVADGGIYATGIAQEELEHSRGLEKAENATRFEAERVRAEELQKQNEKPDYGAANWRAKDR